MPIDKDDNEISKQQQAYTAINLATLAAGFSISMYLLFRFVAYPQVRAVFPPNTITTNSGYDSNAIGYCDDPAPRTSVLIGGQAVMLLQPFFLKACAAACKPHDEMIPYNSGNTTIPSNLQFSLFCDTPIWVFFVAIMGLVLLHALIQQSRLLGGNEAIYALFASIRDVVLRRSNASNTTDIETPTERNRMFKNPGHLQLREDDSDNNPSVPSSASSTPR